MIVGIDEAGRGPLAGPVAVGLVRAPADFDFLTIFPGLNDSKKMTEKNRERIFELLQERVSIGEISYLVAMPTAEQIDKYGIAVVIRTAIESGLSKLVTENEPHKVWLDGSLKAPAQYDQETVIGGDALIPAIMLASVAAKVTRDRLMVELAQEYPVYGFERHKGYGTKAHIAALREHGLSSVHRATFIHFDRLPIVTD
ncbi:MAG: rnhB [Parcubacteria group bacterium]|nr:rnhB [Parcubacteria group bacterium]